MMSYREIETPVDSVAPLWNEVDSDFHLREPSRRVALPADRFSPERMVTAAGFSTLRSAPAWVRRSAHLFNDAVSRRASVTSRLETLAALLRAVDRTFEQGKPHAYLASAQDPGVRLARTDRLTRWFGLLYFQAGKLLQRHLLPELSRNGVRLLRVAQLGAEQMAWAHEQFMRRYYPILTPLAADSGRPFPFISSGSMNLLVELQTPDLTNRRHSRVLYARVKVPRMGQAILPTDGRGPGLASVDTPFATDTYHPDTYPGANPSDIYHPRTYVWAGDLMRYFVDQLFPGMSIGSVYWFRVLRTSGPDTSEDVGIDHSTTHSSRNFADFSSGDETGLRIAARQGGTPVTRLDVEAGMPDDVVRWLVRHLRVPMHGIVRTHVPLELFSLSHLVEGFRQEPVVVNSLA